MTSDSALTSPRSMAKPISTSENRTAKVAVSRATSEPRVLQWFLILLALASLGAILVIPLFVVFAQAFGQGWQLYKAALIDPEAWSAIKLTLGVALLCVPLNTAFGIAAAWAIAKFRFRGKSVLVSLLDLPFAISPVVAGLIFVLMFGRRGFFGPWLDAHDIKIIFAVPGICLATLFVTFPFVARQLIAFMEAQGNEEEEAAVTLGANGFQTFWRVTLPNIKWALLTGIILCNARAMGEFGAVSVVSGHIRGKTNTIPLQVEILYNDYQISAAFAVATLLTFLGLVTLCIKTVFEWKAARELRAGQQQ